MSCARSRASCSCHADFLRHLWGNQRCVYHDFSLSGTLSTSLTPGCVLIVLCCTFTDCLQVTLVASLVKHKLFLGNLSKEMSKEELKSMLELEVKGEILQPFPDSVAMQLTCTSAPSTIHWLCLWPNINRVRSMITMSELGYLQERHESLIHYFCIAQERC